MSISNESTETEFLASMQKYLGSAYTTCYNTVSNTASSIYQKCSDGFSIAANGTASLGNRVVSFCSDTYNANPKVTIAALGTIVTVGAGVALYTFRDKLPDCVQNMLPGKNQVS